MRGYRPLALTVLTFFLTSTALLATTPAWSYRYYKETVGLEFYPLEIVLHDPTPPAGLVPAPGRRQVLLPNGGVAMVDDLGDGWAVRETCARAWTFSRRPMR